MGENVFQDFLHFGAVVKIRRGYRNDLYNFVKLMIEMGIFNKEITYFVNSLKICGDKTMANNLSVSGKLAILDEEYTDDYFWHIVDINEGKRNEVCIEYQYANGFTFGKTSDYTNYDESIKVLSVEELIFSTGKEEMFNLGYKETTFKDELTDEKDKELADELDYFCEFYEWELVKYSNLKYNILDSQTEEFVGYFGDEESDNGSLRDCIERVFYRMVDYFTDEGEHEDIDYIQKEITMFIRLGKKYNLYQDKDIEWLRKWLEEEIEFLVLKEEE